MTKQSYTYEEYLSKFAPKAYQKYIWNKRKNTDWYGIFMESRVKK